MIEIFFKDFIYLFLRERERQRHRQREKEAGSMQGARRGTRSRVSRITPWAEGGTKLLSHRGCPYFTVLKGQCKIALKMSF